MEPPVQEPAPVPVVVVAPPAPNNEHLIAKCKAQEEQLLKKDDEVHALQLKLGEYDSHVKKIEGIFEERLQDMMLQRDHIKSERDSLLEQIKSKNQELDSWKKEHANTIDELLD